MLTLVITSMGKKVEANYWEEVVEGRDIEPELQYGDWIGFPITRSDLRGASLALIWEYSRENKQVCGLVDEVRGLCAKYDLEFSREVLKPYVWFWSQLAYCDINEVHEYLEKQIQKKLNDLIVLELQVGRSREDKVEESGCIKKSEFGLLVGGIFCRLQKCCWKFNWTTLLDKGFHNGVWETSELCAELKKEKLQKAVELTGSQQNLTAAEKQKIKRKAADARNRIKNIFPEQAGQVGLMHTLVPMRLHETYFPKIIIEGVYKDGRFDFDNAKLYQDQDDELVVPCGATVPGVVFVMPKKTRKRFDHQAFVEVASFASEAIPFTKKVSSMQLVAIPCSISVCSCCKGEIEYDAEAAAEVVGEISEKSRVIVIETEELFLEGKELEKWKVEHKDLAGKVSQVVSTKKRGVGIDELAVLVQRFNSYYKASVVDKIFTECVDANGWRPDRIYDRVFWLKALRVSRNFYQEDFLTEKSAVVKRITRRGVKKSEAMKRIPLFGVDNYRSDTIMKRAKQAESTYLSLFNARKLPAISKKPAKIKLRVAK